VLWCEERGLRLEDVTAEQAAGVHPALRDWSPARLDPRAAAEGKRSRGGTAPGEIARQVEMLRSTLERKGETT
jgi:argininosuccinate lyase